MRALSAHERQAGALEIGLGHGQHGADDNQRADGQEEPLFEANAAAVVAQRRQHEFDRGPGDFAMPAAIPKVNQDRRRGGRQPGEHRHLTKAERQWAVNGWHEQFRGRIAPRRHVNRSVA